MSSIAAIPSFSLFSLQVKGSVVVIILMGGVGEQAIIIYYVLLYIFIYIIYSQVPRES